MPEQEVVSQLNKGGITWVDLSIVRDFEGFRIHLKAVKQIEDFIQSLCGGPLNVQKDKLELYGDEWYAISPSSLNVYRFVKNLPRTSEYTFDAVAEPLRSHKDGDQRINLSFLRFEGISSPSGVEFGVRGPHSRAFVRDLSADIINRVRGVVLEYIVPVHFNLRISSQEL